MRAPLLLAALLGCAVAKPGEDRAPICTDPSCADCAPLGAIFRANPAIIGPPDGVLRDEGYRAFQGRRSKRRPALPTGR